MKSIAWLKSASVLQLVTGGVHGLTLFSRLQPTNETEKQMVDLMYSYKMQMGAGFEPTMGELYVALSSCFTLMYVMMGIINLYLLKHTLSIKTWKGLIAIQVIFFGIGFILMFSLTFLPPVLLTGAVFTLLIISYFKTRPVEE